MDTLLLDQTNWDLLTDSAGNIALASNPYSIAQDVASAIRLFLAELWYDNTKGVPYFTEILGQAPPITVFKQYLVTAALTVPQVVEAQCIVQTFDTSTRTVTGQVQVIDVDGVEHNVTF